MSRATVTTTDQTASRTATRDLILALADSKRLLGTRYAEWILGAPELETGIACASMAQDEWGHGRLLYALLKEFGDDVDRLEHGREPGEYTSIEALDQAPGSWPELVAINAFIDSALTVMLQALADSSHTPLRQRVAKLIDEEQFHALHATAWCRRLASVDATRSRLAAAARAHVPVALRWFGPPSAAADALLDSGVIRAAPDPLRAEYVTVVRPMLEAFGEAALLEQDIDFSGFNDATRRVDASGPDAATIARVRGDKNRAFLMD